MRLSRTDLVPVALVALGLVSAEGVAAKCTSGTLWPGLEPNGAVLMLDGSIVDGAIGGIGLDFGSRKIVMEVDPSDVDWAELTCWNPATGEFGGAVGVPVWRFRTKPFVESTRAPIEALLRAQKAHFSQHSSYAQSLDDLVGFGLPQDAMLEFSATSAGWSATTPRDDVAYRCFVYSGNVMPELAEMKEHEVVCQTENAKGNRAMRERYESLVKG